MRMTLCGTALVVFLKYVDLEWNLNFFTTNKRSPACWIIYRSHRLCLV